MGAAAETLAALRTAVARVEAGGGRSADADGRIGFGVGAIDAALGGGLRRGALHAVAAVTPSGAGAAVGLAAALAAHAARDGGGLLWVRQDMSGRESGEPWPIGLAEFGLDPNRVVLVRAPDVDAVLKTAETALGCPGLAAAVIEPFGPLKGFDRVAGRRLALAAGRTGAFGLMLRLDAVDAQPAGLSAAETRWLVGPASSPQGDEAWGRPRMTLRLARNRFGALGRWAVEWDRDDSCFRSLDPVLGRAAEPAHPGGRAAEPRRRPGAENGEVRPFRRAG